MLIYFADPTSVSTQPAFDQTVLNSDDSFEVMCGYKALDNIDISIEGDSGLLRIARLTYNIQPDCLKETTALLKWATPDVSLRKSLNEQIVSCVGGPRINFKMTIHCRFIRF